MHVLFKVICIFCLIDFMNCGTLLKVGDLKTKDHSVNGTVYIFGENNMLLKRFNYDGKQKTNIIILIKYIIFMNVVTFFHNTFQNNSYLLLSSTYHRKKNSKPLS